VVVTRDRGTGEAQQYVQMCNSMTSLLMQKKDLKEYVGLMHDLNAFPRVPLHNSGAEQISQKLQ